MNAITSTEMTALPISSASAGALLMSTEHMNRLEKVADLMASGKTTVPQHLRGSKGDCFAICLQSMQWGMNPFAVAQKTHLVNGTLGYEAQLVAAVINSSGVVLDRFHFEWFGEWEKIVGQFKEVVSQTKKDDNGNPKKYIVPAWNQADERGLGVKVWATLRGETQPRVLTLLLTQARTRNSTLWAEDPKQQIAYLVQKRWARLYAPDVILGVYTRDELEQGGETFMGAADMVQPGEDAPPPSSTASHVEDPKPPEKHAFYPQADFDKNLTAWVGVVMSGRKTIDMMLTFIGAKAALSPEQQQAFKDAVKAAQKASAEDVAAKDAPQVSVEKLVHDMKAAASMDQLCEVAALGDAITDPAVRAQLDQVFDARAAELKAQA